MYKNELFFLLPTVSALSSLSQGTSILSHHLSDNLPKIGLLLTSEFTEDSRNSPEIDEKDQNSISKQPNSGEENSIADEDTSNTAQCIFSMKF